MGAPVIIAAALANTRTGRKVLIGILIVILLAVGFVITPLVAIPFAIAGQSVTAGEQTTPVAAKASGEWGYPLAGAYTKGRGFGYNPVVGCGFCSTDHKGYDMAEGCGATVYAAGPGRVITSGPYQGYGNAVRIDHGGDVVSLYGHMEWGSIRVAVGDNVTAGIPLGAEGNTGRSFGCHLHFEIQQGGTPIDPQPFMAARGVPLT